MDLMRQLEEEHKSLWDHLAQPKPEMVAASDCDPALLSGWTDRDISLWDVSAIGGKPGMQDILVALCRKKRDWDKISYLRFPKEAVSLSGLILTDCNGKTGDQRVDTSHTHFEIKGITGKELCTLLFHVSKSKIATGTFTKRELDKILFDNYDRMSTRPVVPSSTSLTMQISSPSSGSGVQAATTEVVQEQIVSETPTPEQLPRPSSSTT